MEMGCLLVLPTVGFTVVQLISVQQPLIAIDIVPIEEGHSLGQRSLSSVSTTLPDLFSPKLVLKPAKEYPSDTSSIAIETSVGEL